MRFALDASRRFAVDAAHELQTPLTALRTNLELAPQDAFVRQAQSQVGRLWTLAQSLLDLSRLETGNPMEGKGPVDLVHLMQELGELCASRAQQAGLAFDLDLPRDPVTIMGNGGQFRQAVCNLLDNAIKFTTEGGRIRMGLGQEATHVVLWVEKTGIGIPEEDISHLGGRFHRSRNAANFPGNGLGMAIVNAVVDNRGGSIMVESAEGRGTRFSLNIPRVL